MLFLDPSILLDARGPQAGGGGAFGGGGDGGFDFGEDGDGAGQIVWLLVRLVLVHPRIGLPLCAVALAVFVLGARRGWWKHQERVIRRERPQRRAHASAAVAAELRASDPGFDEKRLLERVRRAFFQAQESWCAQDLEPLRPFVSDGVFERFALQIEEQRQDGWRQGMARLVVEPLAIVHVASGRHFDALTVRVPFRADIHRVDLASGERIRGSRLPREAFAECWSFVRRRGARSLTGEGLIEGKCPDCGAPLAMNRSARCGHCQCLARSGQFDWVLAEITQESEWRPGSERDVAGLERYAERDPGIDAQMLEDHASVAFWRWSAAERAGRVDPLLRVAEAQLCQQLAARIAPDRDGERTYTGDQAVGSVRTLGLLAGSEQDRALVEVVWDGRAARVDTQGGRRLDAVRRLRRTLLVFARRAGERTELTQAFTTMHCGGCGAHDEGGTAPTCAWCGAPRSGDGSTWLLHGLVERGSSAERVLVAELRALRPLSTGPAAALAPSAAALLAWAIELLRSDERIDERERRAVHALGLRLGVASERIELLLASPAAAGAAPAAANPVQARAWLGALVELALADGSLGRAERRFLRSASERLGLRRAELAALMQAARRTLYRASRAAR